MKSLSRALVALAAVSGAATSVARADAPNLSGFPFAGPFFAASTGTVEVTFLFSRASFTNYLVLFDAVGGTGTLLMTVPGAYPLVGTPIPPTPVSFAVTAGDALLFGICSDGATGGGTSLACTALTGDPGNTWYSGILNADGFFHTKTLTGAVWNALNGPCSLEVIPCADAPVPSTVLGFEDKSLPTADFDEPDYNDIVFAFTNIGETTVPEPATMGLLALGLVGMSGAGLLRRRSARKNTK